MEIIKSSEESSKAGMPTLISGYASFPVAFKEIADGHQVDVTAAMISYFLSVSV